MVNLAYESQPQPATLQAAINAFDLTVESEFIPWSQSRSATKEKKFNDYNLNWRVTLKRAGRAVLTADYSAGMAYCPSYKQGARATVAYAETIMAECETGFQHHWSDGFGSPVRLSPGKTSKSILPNAADVIHSLVLDSDVLDYGSFEEWASEFGYDADSRKAEPIYRACLEIALKLRNALGDDGLRQLREAAQDY